MSRGWESKSVESQQAEPLSAVPSAPSTQQGNVAADAENKRRLQALHLQRERILSERTSSPHRRNALTNALADVEEKLGELGWTLHL